MGLRWEEGPELAQSLGVGWDLGSLRAVRMVGEGRHPDLPPIFSVKLNKDAFESRK